MWDYGNGMMSGFGTMHLFGFGIVHLILVGLVVYAVVKLVQGNFGSGNNNAPNKSNDAIHILNKRYASGEITEEEYTKKKKMIND